MGAGAGRRGCRSRPASCSRRARRARLEQPGDQPEPAGQAGRGIAAPPSSARGELGQAVGRGVGVERAPADERRQVVAGRPARAGRPGSAAGGRGRGRRAARAPSATARRPRRAGGGGAGADEQRRPGAVAGRRPSSRPRPSQPGPACSSRVEPGRSARSPCSRSASGSGWDSRPPARSPAGPTPAACRASPIAGCRPTPSSTLISRSVAQPERLAVPGVALVAEGDDGVDPVVAAVELDDDQDAAVALGLGGAGRAGRGSPGRSAPGRSATSRAGSSRGSRVA